MQHGYAQQIKTAAASETEILFLSGKGNDDTIKWDFFCTAGRNSGKWTKIAVPSNWELQGFGKYDYGFRPDSLRGKEKGLYKRTFKIPAAWKGKKINLVFEGSMTDTEVKINGTAAGAIHQGSFYAFKYDISKLVTFGKTNLLEVTVSKHSANPSVNAAERKADFWLFGGIFRPVFLEALPVDHLERVALDAKADGTLKGRIAFKGEANQLSIALYTADGTQLGNIYKKEWGSGVSEVLFQTQYTGTKQWSAESPVLYTAIISLYKDGKLLHSLRQKTGFRSIVVKQRDGLYVNGAKIKFKGVNRHSFWPTSGRTTSKKISVADVLLMKDMNMNAVRMSHYPPDAHFLDVCDSLGLYVMDELAGWHGQYDTPTGSKLVPEMIAHDENHPSIIFWSNGNEGGHNLELDTLFAEQDLQHRPVIHPWMAFGGFDTQHYREYNYGIGNYDHGHNIVMPTELLHGLFDGGHGAGLEDYWKAMWINPLSAGGFLWDFADQGVLRTDQKGRIDTDGNHGADGIVGPFHEKEGSYFAIKEIWSPVYVEHRELSNDFDGTFNLENRFDFTNLKDCSFSWKLENLARYNSGTSALVKNTDVLRADSGNAVAPDILPLAKGKLQLDLPKNWNTYTVLYLKIKGPDGRELFTWSFPVKRPDEIARLLVPENGNGKVVVRATDKRFEVSVKDLRISVSRDSGILEKLSNGKGDIPFTNGPILQEGLNNFRNFSSRREGETVVISSEFNRKTAYNTLKWTIYPSGWVKMEVVYFPGAYFTNFAGVNFSFPEKQLKGVRYMGNGPNRVWKNRMKGNLFGVWNKAYNDAATGEYPSTYPEFKGYHSNMYWITFNTTGQPFTVVTDQEDMFFRLFSPKKSDDQYDNLQPTFPSGDISFMQAISGIGTKTQKPETTGPMGMKNIFYDYEKEPLRAKHLVLYFDFTGKELRND
ncbi:MAG: glycoside hydrolase family 2 TIM barrel-domain containing protein [Pedobacter sp.]|uniref:glycoside hydrolase family 2 protein n=1 Tax=Pedobacter sp. TaxID=1411316 RepID=UPI0033979616